MTACVRRTQLFGYVDRYVICGSEALRSLDGEFHNPVAYLVDLHHVLERERAIGACFTEELADIFGVIGRCLDDLPLEVDDVSSGATTVEHWSLAGNNRRVGACIGG